MPSSADCDRDEAGGGPGGGPGKGMPGCQPFLVDPDSDGSLLGPDELPLDIAPAEAALLAAGA